VISNTPTLIKLIQPARIFFGAGCSEQVAAELVSRKAKRVLAVCYTSEDRLPPAILGGCRAAGMEVQTLCGVPAEPSVDDFEALRLQVAGCGADAVLAIGGGSVIDIAKLLSALLETPGSVRDFFGNDLLAPRRRALIAVPTTSGAGSEASPNAILYDAQDSLKKAVISPWLMPDAAFVDPQLTVSLPASITAATGLDALTHCLEAYTNRFAHPAVDLYALEGMRLISGAIVRAVRKGGDLEARADVARGSLYGGLCLGPVNTAAVHALAYPLGSRFRLAHGLSNALLLPHVFRYNIPAATQRCAAAARALGAAPGGDDADTAQEGARLLTKLCADCGLPPSLSALKIARDSIPIMAADAMKITRLLKNNPREMGLEAAIRIYEEAF
jgi:alcohol dehydrogenase class IV